MPDEKNLKLVEKTLKKNQELMGKVQKQNEKRPRFFGRIKSLMKNSAKNES